MAAEKRVKSTRDGRLATGLQNPTSREREREPIPLSPISPFPSATTLSCTVVGLVETTVTRPRTRTRTRFHFTNPVTIQSCNTLLVSQPSPLWHQLAPQETSVSLSLSAFSIFLIGVAQPYLYKCFNGAGIILHR